MRVNSFHLRIIELLQQGREQTANYSERRNLNIKNDRISNGDLQGRTSSIAYKRKLYFYSRTAFLQTRRIVINLYQFSLPLIRKKIYGIQYIFSRKAVELLNQAKFLEF
jgi:hypothetical protein